MAAVGRRLTSLRRLSLQHMEHVSGPALECLSGLTRLTDLTLGAAYEFGQRALSALLPLTDLRRLSLFRAPLTEADVEAVLAPDEDTPLLLPHLTYLSMTNCQMLGGSGLARLAAALSALRWLVHRGSPYLQQLDLHTVLQSCHNLRLLQTSWRPAEPPSSIGAKLVIFDADIDAGNASMLTAANDLDEPQRQQLQRWVEDWAFCQAWHFCLQPG